MIQQGRNLIIKLNGYALAGARSCSIKTDAEMLETSSPTSGKARTYISGKTGWTISCSHLVVDNQYMELPLTVGQSVDLQLVEKTTGIGLKGKAFIKTCDMQMTLGNLAQGSLQLQGNGELLKNLNLLPSLTSGWQDQFGNTTNYVYYISNYGIVNNQGSGLVAPAVQVKAGTTLCFSLRKASTFNPSSVTFGWASTYDSSQPTYNLVEANSQSVNTSTYNTGANDVIYAAWTAPIDCYVTVYIAVYYDVHYLQLEEGSTPTPFKAPISQQQQ